MWSIRIKSRQINCLHPGRCFDANSKLISVLAACSTLIHVNIEKYRKLLIVNIVVAYFEFYCILIYICLFWLRGVIFRTVLAFDAKVPLFSGLTIFCVSHHEFIIKDYARWLFFVYYFSSERNVREHHHTIIYF